jgi:hypothetical protein
MMNIDPSPRIAWFELATGLLGASKPVADHAIWKLLPVASVRPEWLLEASWIEMSGSGFFKATAPVAASLGCTAEFSEHLSRLSKSNKDHVASWAQRELHAAS